MQALGSIRKCTLPLGAKSTSSTDTGTHWRTKGDWIHAIFSDESRCGGDRALLDGVGRIGIDDNGDARHAEFLTSGPVSSEFDMS